MTLSHWFPDWDLLRGRGTAKVKSVSYSDPSPVYLLVSTPSGEWRLPRRSFYKNSKLPGSFTTISLPLPDSHLFINHNSDSPFFAEFLEGISFGGLTPGKPSLCMSTRFVVPVVFPGLRDGHLEKSVTLRNRHVVQATSSIKRTLCIGPFWKHQRYPVLDLRSLY